MLPFLLYLIGTSHSRHYRISKRKKKSKLFKGCMCPLIKRFLKAACVLRAAYVSEAVCISKTACFPVSKSERSKGCACSKGSECSKGCTGSTWKRRYVGTFKSCISYMRRCEVARRRRACRSHHVFLTISPYLTVSNHIISFLLTAGDIIFFLPHHRILPYHITSFLPTAGVIISFLLTADWPRQCPGEVWNPAIRKWHDICYTL